MAFLVVSVDEVPVPLKFSPRLSGAFDWSRKYSLFSLAFTNQFSQALPRYLGARLRNREFLSHKYFAFISFMAIVYDARGGRAVTKFPVTQDV
jgi:hypothetical protein